MNYNKAILIVFTVFINSCASNPNEGDSDKLDRVLKATERYNFEYAKALLSSSKSNSFDIFNQRSGQLLKDYEKSKLTELISLFESFADKCNSKSANNYSSSQMALACLKSSVNRRYQPKDLPAYDDGYAVKDNSGSVQYPFGFMNNENMYKRWWAKFYKNEIEKLEKVVNRFKKLEIKNNLVNNSEFKKCSLKKDIEFLKSQVGGAKAQLKYYEEQGKIKGFYTKGDVQQMGYRKQLIHFTGKNIKEKENQLRKYNNIEVNKDTCSKYIEFYK